MDFATLFIILMIVIFTGVGWVVFWAIKHAQKNNMTYKNFASEQAMNLTKLKETITIETTLRMLLAMKRL